MKRIQLRVILTVLGTLAAPAIVYAVVQSLNGVTGSTQTFVNDSTISILSSSSANTHTLTWNGILPASRGGTGMSSISGFVTYINTTADLAMGSNVISFEDAPSSIFTVGGNGTANQFVLSFTGGEAILDSSLMQGSTRIFTFPNANGTFGLLEANQIWTGLNKFEATASSSLYVGSSTKTGCIVMGDSDGSGVTYVTANNGVLTATTTKPSICQ